MTAKSSLFTATSRTKCRFVLKYRYPKDWCEVDGVEVFRNGNGAGGEHGASVVISYYGNAEEVTEAYTTATHIITWDAKYSYTEYTNDDWKK